MSWIRIDDDTYIDDSLVTCAEYQLFIDEMRSHGKYHQPDHWNSYKFPAGQAREPVLGVRYSDAVTFCEWLTSKYGNNWLFRIPSNPEFERISFGPEMTEIGCWASQSAFITKAIPDPYPNFRHLPDNAIDIIADAFQDVEKKSGIPNYFYTIRNIISSGSTKTDADTPLSQAQISCCIPLDIGRYFFSENVIRDVLGVNLRLQDFRKNIELHEQLAEFHFEEAISYARSFIAGEENYLIQNFSAYFDAYIKKQPKFIQFSLSLSLYDITNIKNAAILASARDFLIYFCIDMLTLSERIAGRSPAFEGIRLVKERIK